MIFAVDEVLQDVKEHDSGKPSMTVLRYYHQTLIFAVDEVLQDEHDSGEPSMTLTVP